MRVDPQNIKMKEIIESGKLGKLAIYRRRHSLATQNMGNFETTWHASPELNRDIFADDSSHPIDMMHWIFGMPETVSCEMSTIVNPKVPNDTGIALFKYANGMVADISCQFTTTAAEIGTEVYGSTGSIQQYFDDGPSTRLPHEGKVGLKWYFEGDEDWTNSDIPSPKGHFERIINQAPFMAEFLKGGPSVCTAEEGRDSLRLVMACYLLRPHRRARQRVGRPGVRDSNFRITAGGFLPQLRGRRPGGRGSQLPRRYHPLQFLLKSFRFPGAKTAKKRFLLWKMGFSGAKIDPCPPYTPLGTIGSSSGLWPSRAL